MSGSTLRAALGPGLLMAGAAVGVSHLVQATRAGAEYGLALLALVVVGCGLKYPFLEFGPRYAAATGEHMIAGYRRLGRLPLAIYAFLTVSTMFTVLASITLVTAGLAGTLFGLDWSTPVVAVAILLPAAAILAVGHYRGLDRIMKVLMAFLALATLAAVVLAAGRHADWTALMPAQAAPMLWTGAGLGFVLALLGWMPIPLDTAAWHSLWTLERSRETGQQPSVRHATADFAIGYLGATVLAAAFLVLGALVMFGSGRTLAGTAVEFSAQLVEMYAAALGQWARGLIAFTALATMLSTTLTVADAFPRVLRALLEMTDHSRADTVRRRRPRYLAGMFVTMTGAWLIVALVGRHFTLLIDFTTTVSFLAAPVIAWLNLKLITGPHTPAAAQPGRGLRALSWAGLMFLAGFSLAWLVWRLG
ncbi:MAG: Nramp family divalent metal transporter [Wenzhouxiangellaceae bacterium]|nr:Nramp family divalent metal transporter [Wenzhouxiangellaceae bacterium]